MYIYIYIYNLSLSSFPPGHHATGLIPREGKGHQATKGHRPWEAPDRGPETTDKTHYGLTDRDGASHWRGEARSAFQATRSTTYPWCRDGTEGIVSLQPRRSNHITSSPYTSWGPPGKNASAQEDNNRENARSPKCASAACSCVFSASNVLYVPVMNKR